MSGEFDLIVIGGGAAGFFGAIAFAESSPGSRVVILEKTDAVLGKVKISGGGRCNVTHAAYDPGELTPNYPRGEKNLIGPFYRWAVGDTIDWFESRGVELKVEEDGRMFPTTDDSQTIINCLTDAAEDSSVMVEYRCSVDSLSKSGEQWEVGTKSGGLFRGKNVLLATGGVRNGAGTELAGAVGHTIIPAAPSLFTFKVADPRIEELSGVSVSPVIAELPELGHRTTGPCLITHWGLSGPAILKLSALAARELAEREYRFKVKIHWLGGMSEEEADGLLGATREASPKKFVRSGAEGTKIPLRLWQRFVGAAGIDEEMCWSNLSKKERHRLVQQLTASEFAVNGKSMNKDEFVTAGGVDRNEVDFRTMESRIASGLFFAGEVLDVDGVTGGFNFQAAWTTGRIAGEAAAESLAG
ncbi:MAG: NAD(P)/FAD-dependent oxidoreductase [Verrucomicrobiales bacterium]|nr:NAD(P)/FAD-dependent oxidoreductase [Verrucomicrobiales bacterium]